MALVNAPAIARSTLPLPPEHYDARDQRELRRTIEQHLQDLSAKSLPARPFIYATDYGVVGDDNVDDTDAMQAALDAGGELGAVVYAGSLVIKTTSGLTGSGPGLVFDSVAYGGVDDPIGIHFTGESDTGLTWNPVRITHFSATVWGDGQSANGIYLNHITGSFVQKVRVLNFNGFGLKIDKLWDSLLGDVSIELCGNTTDYAFSLNAGDDTSNMSHICRLQVEQANAKAILIDSSTLSSLIDNIHSERATAVPGYTTWDIGATRSVFNAARFTALNPTDATIYFRGENCTFNGMAVEGAVAVIFDAVSLSTCVFNAPNFSDAAGSIDLNDHSGLIQINAGMLGTLNASAEIGRPLTLECIGTKITMLNVGDVGNPSLPTLLAFRDCTIGTLGSTSTNSAATFDHCVIAEGGNLLQAMTVLQGGTVVTCAGTLSGSGCIVARDSTINANVTMASGSTLLGYALRVNGNLSQSLDCSSLLDAASYATGTVTGLGMPTKQPSARALIDQVWRVGQRQHNLTAASGGPSGWICTTAGGDGTFVFTDEAVVGGTTISTADSKAVSAGVRASVADSKAESAGAEASTADSKAASAAVEAAAADSRASSAASQAAGAESDALSASAAASDCNSRLTSAGF